MGSMHGVHPTHREIWSAIYLLDPDLEEIDRSARSNMTAQIRVTDDEDAFSLAPVMWNAMLVTCFVLLLLNAGNP